MRRAKIVCTLGPASGTLEMVERLVVAGMDCARLNFSHGEHETHAKTAALVREAAARARRPVAILADLCGPKMRVGRFPGGSTELERGKTVRITSDDVPSDAGRISVTYPYLAEDVSPGDRILLDDGLLELRVASIEGRDVLAEVVVGGTLGDRKGLNLPGVRLRIPSLTEKDKVDPAFAVDELRVDYAALSFVRTADDVREAQALSKGTPIIAKMEKPEAIDNLSSIAEAAEGLMVARGDLGVEMGSEKVPIVQKRIIHEVNRRGKIVITATQMLDSMIRNPRPTRAEAADVANAVLDGTDAVMLSGETASGKYPVESVEMMSRIVVEVEQEERKTHTGHAGRIEHSLLTEWSDWAESNAAARAAALLSHALPLKVLVVFSRSGTTAALLSEYRPRCPIIAITHDARVASRLALEWGVAPYLEIPPDDMQEMLRLSTALLVREKLAVAGDSFAIVCAWPASARPNTVKLHRL